MAPGQARHGRTRSDKCKVGPFRHNLVIIKDNKGVTQDDLVFLGFRANHRTSLNYCRERLLEIILAAVAAQEPRIENMFPAGPF